MTVKYYCVKDSGLSLANAHRMFRLRHRETGEYLHTSGHGTTPSTLWAWLGYAHQANTLQDRARERGEDWPYEPTSRTGDPLHIKSLQEHQKEHHHEA